MSQRSRDITNRTGVSADGRTIVGYDDVSDRGWIATVPEPASAALCTGAAGPGAAPAGPAQSADLTAGVPNVRVLTRPSESKSATSRLHVIRDGPDTCSTGLSPSLVRADSFRSMSLLVTSSLSRSRLTGGDEPSGEPIPKSTIEAVAAKKLPLTRVHHASE